MDAGALRVHPDLERHITDRLAGDRDLGSVGRAKLASAVQSRLGDLLVGLLAEVCHHVGLPNVCLGGSLFYHSFANTLVKQAALFDTVFVPVDPGPGGLAIGAVLHALGHEPSLVTPFLGPSYSAQETKEVLDNCKLQYSWETEEGAVQAAVQALRDGRLVGWFDGPMEWGPRAVGARCILANPEAPYVLENLNRFLKRREPWRGYALSGLQESVVTYFDGPAAAPFMECDYLPKDRARFRHILPSPEAAIRVHTVSAEGGLPHFRRLLEAFGEATGLPFLVNTSFNGFHEPIVCSPRDAVRVFYGSGLDLLVMNQFVLRK
jgi:carbamoyltransferase